MASIDCESASGGAPCFHTSGGVKQDRVALTDVRSLRGDPLQRWRERRSRKSACGDVATQNKTRRENKSPDPGKSNRCTSVCRLRCVCRIRGRGSFHSAAYSAATDTTCSLSFCVFSQLYKFTRLRFTLYRHCSRMRFLLVRRDLPSPFQPGWME